jgi:DNA-binding CsgD family transcriptional regulator
MEAAINLTEYFRATAKKVYRLISQPKHELTLKEAAIFLKGKGHSQSAIARMLKCSQQNVNKIFSQL